MERAQKIAGLSDKLERFEAIDGREILPGQFENLCLWEWNATNNSRWDRSIAPPFEKKLTSGEVGCILSHIAVWQDLAAHPKFNATMLILEDDVVFYPGTSESQSAFVEAFASLTQALPLDWDLLYLGFCNCGPRKSIVSSTTLAAEGRRVPIELFRPTYGFYTHAYALTRSAARQLLSLLPVSAPLDVWLADNAWFGLNVYVSVIPSDAGLKGKGVSLIAQHRVDSDIVHSAHHREVK